MAKHAAVLRKRGAEWRPNGCKEHLLVVLGILYPAIKLWIKCGPYSRTPPYGLVIVQKGGPPRPPLSVASRHALSVATNHVTRLSMDCKHGKKSEFVAREPSNLAKQPNNRKTVAYIRNPRGNHTVCPCHWFSITSCTKESSQEEQAGTLLIQS